ncbi:hypothetical protein GNF80_00025 [Clostridium perfringens]|nr:hypothetical protein [Clostridium perfringens]
MTFEEVQEMIKKPFVLEETGTVVTVRNPERYKYVHDNLARCLLPNNAKFLEDEEC